MDIVIACDESYLPHAATMLCSLFENNTSRIKIHLLHDGIRKRKLKHLRDFLAKYNAEFKDYKIHNMGLVSVNRTSHFSNSIYFRILIPEILPVSLNKVLYLDCDLIVRKPLDALWNIDLQHYLLAAIEDDLNLNDRYKKQIGFPLNSSYFNSGVLLINLDQWRRQSFHMSVIDYIKNNPVKLPFPYKDGLNIISNGNWLKLPMNWNVQHTHYFSQKFSIRFADIIADPGIVHFTGAGYKPWQKSKYHHPFSDEYDKYRQKTPWKKYKLENWPRRGVKQVMKEYIKVILRFISRNNWLLKINGYMFKAADFIRSSGEKKANKNTNQIHSMVIREIKALIPNQVVVAGPFKGMKYPSIEAFGSTIAPKLLGTYEIELNNIIEDICDGNYSKIIDIGCAEGYYAIGFALRISDVHVYAYDNNPKARELCQAMAKTNSVEDRVNIEKIFTMRSIQNIHPKDHGFIICDCEGAEEYIFYNDNENWRNLIDHFDLLIEIHDMFRPGVSGYIYDLFSASHNITIINSINDFLRPRIFTSSILSNIDSTKREYLMAEERLGIMPWFYMKRKHPDQFG